MIIRNTLPNTELKTSDFAYDLPEERIAQVPIEPRDASRLMVLDRQAQTVTHKHFYDILDYLEPGDTLVINDSRVIPARILGKKINADGSDGAECEVLLLRQHEQDVWEALVRPGRRLKVGARIDFHGILTGEIIELVEDGNRKLRFTYDPAKFTNIYEVLNKIGSMPLPPYITEKLTDNERYQTVYSKIEGCRADCRPAFYEGASCKNPREGRGHRTRYAPRGSWHLPSGEGREHHRPYYAHRVHLRLP